METCGKQEMPFRQQKFAKKGSEIYLLFGPNREDGHFPVHENVYRLFLKLGGIVKGILFSLHAKKLLNFNDISKPFEITVSRNFRITKQRVALTCYLKNMKFC